jgi:WD40 repeat protein
MCVRRPLVATCSSDHTVRLWNYADRTCDLSKWFAEEAHSIAIHPTGLMVRGQLQPSNTEHQQLLVCHANMASCSKRDLHSSSVICRILN